MSPEITHAKIVLSFLLIAVIMSSGCSSSEDEISGKIGDLLSMDTSKMTKQELAVATGNPEVCQDATYVDVCITAVAKSENDITICDEIADPKTRSQCVAAVRLQAEGLEGVNCGKVGQTCCPGDFCEWGMECRSDDKCHVYCGKQGYECCGGTDCDSDDSLICHNGKCLQCGHEKEHCCEDGKCLDSLLVCLDGYCRYEVVMPDGTRVPTS